MYKLFFTADCFAYSLSLGSQILIKILSVDQPLSAELARINFSKIIKFNFSRNNLRICGNYKSTNFNLNIILYVSLQSIPIIFFATDFTDSYRLTQILFKLFEKQLKLCTSESSPFVFETIQPQITQICKNYFSAIWCNLWLIKK